VCPPEIGPNRDGRDADTLTASREGYVFPLIVCTLFFFIRFIPHLQFRSLNQLLTYFTTKRRIYHSNPIRHVDKMATLDTTTYIVTTFTKGLNALVHILQVAESHAHQQNIDFNTEYLPARIAADMKPLSFQIQNATNTIKLHLGRLRGEAYPVWEDDEKTIGELYGRIERAREILRDFNDRETVKVRGRLAAGEEVEM
jgi:hypothetical protein